MKRVLVFCLFFALVGSLRAADFSKAIDIIQKEGQLFFYRWEFVLSSH